jgi:hypothetical protein
MERSDKKFFVDNVYSATLCRTRLTIAKQVYATPRLRNHYGSQTRRSHREIGMLEILTQILSKYGLVVLVLVLLLAFVCFLMWKLTWNVWSKAMESKDQEIQRISLQRDKYQALVFAQLESSAVDTADSRNDRGGMKE